MDSTLRINESYKAQFEKEKRKEQLTKKSVKIQLKSRPDPVGDDASSSDDEDDDGQLLTPELDSQIHSVLSAIRKRDSSIYDPEVKLYQTSDLNAVPVVKKSKKSKTVKEILTKQMMEGDDSSSDEDNELTDKNSIRIPFNEQDKARRAFLGGQSDSDDELPLTLIGTDLPKSIPSDYEAFVAAQNKRRAERPVPEGKSLARFNDDHKLDDEDRFLKQYISGEWWKEKDFASQPSIDKVEEELSEDEEFLDRQDSFEAAYNFRFEEPDANRIITHPREIEGSLRRVDDRRAKRREKRKESKRRKAMLVAEEVKQAKNEKKKELLARLEAEEMHQLRAMQDQTMEEKIDVVKSVSGLSADTLRQLDLSGDYDPAEFDAKMQSLFNDDWYENGDAEDAEFKTERKQVRTGIAPKLATSFPTNNEKSAAMLEELYALDYEDCIADGLRTRFQYVSVPSHDYGMPLEEILSLDDRDLNSRISLKKLAPYRTDRNLKHSWQKLKAVSTSRHRRQLNRKSNKE